MICYTCLDTIVGNVTVAEEHGGILGVWLEDQKYFPDFINNAVYSENIVLSATVMWLKRYFANERPDISELYLTPLGKSIYDTGGGFSFRIWRMLCDIPYGETVSYGILARKAGTSARAVGYAVGHNPISIIVPCHRVVGANGALTGYAGGIERKKILLEHEMRL